MYVGSQRIIAHTIEPNTSLMFLASAPASEKRKNLHHAMLRMMLKAISASTKLDKNIQDDVVVFDVAFLANVLDVMANDVQGTARKKPQTLL